MPEILLTNGGVAVVDDADYSSVAAFRWQRMNGSFGHYYAHRCIGKGVTVLMHRVIMDAPKGVSVDHIDNDGLNNRRGNLRIATQSQNLANRAAQKNNKYTTFKGVSYCARCKLPWRARCVRKTLGYFTTEIEAAHAYDVAALAHWGEFAVLNFARNQQKI